jgi:hypothetical protein
VQQGTCTCMPETDPLGPLRAIFGLVHRGKQATSFDNLLGAQPARTGSLGFRHAHLGFNRVGDEAILMGGVMHLIELFRTGLSVVAPRNLWA